MRVFLATLPEKGHINPMIGVAQQLRTLDVDLSFYAPADCSPQLRAAGLQVQVCSPIETGFSWPEEHCTRGAEFAERSRDSGWLQRWIRRLLLDTVDGEVAGLRALIREHRPDVVVVDPMYYAAIIAAQCEGVPWAGLSSSLNPVTPSDWQCPLVDTIDGLSEDRYRLFESYGNCPAFRVCDAVSPWLNIAFTTEAYARPEPSDVPCSFCVGPTAPMGPRGDESAMPWHRLDEHCPLIYMSLGSQNFSHEPIFACVINALAGALEDGKVQVVLALHDLMDSDFARSLPANVIPLRYAPQLDLLKRAALVVSHGGANTVMETLHRGVPMLLLPLLNDQHLQARFLERSGAGIVLHPETMTIGSCRSAINALLAPDNVQKQKAVEIGRSYRAHDGARESARLIVELATHRKPLLPPPARI